MKYTKKNKKRKHTISLYPISKSRSSSTSRTKSRPISKSKSKTKKKQKQKGGLKKFREKSNSYPNDEMIAKHIKVKGMDKNKLKEQVDMVKKYHLSYNPKKWNNDIYNMKAHNCYSYFLNKQHPLIRYDCKKQYQKHGKYKNGKINTSEYIPCGKPQPGAHAGLPRLKKNKYTCKNMNKRILADNPSIRKTTMKKGCKKHEYMGAMVIQPNETYHFYRRDNDGLWSHKKGATPITRHDASGKLIKDPLKSDRNFGELNYSKFCHHYCIPTNPNKKHSSLYIN